MRCLVPLLSLLIATGCAVKDKPPVDTSAESPAPVTHGPIPGIDEPATDGPIPGIDEPMPIDPIDALLMPESGDLPDPNDPASMEPKFAPVMALTARYRIEPTAGGKKLQSVMLVGDDGRVYSRAYRPIPSEYQFADKKVAVTGRPYVNSPYVQSVWGLHFEVQSIELAEGETAWDPVPTTIPAPPLARTADAAKAQDGWYATCVGSADGATFTFADGGTMPIAKATANLPDLVGETITLLGSVSGGALRPVAMCDGVVPRCGIEDVE